MAAFTTAALVAALVPFVAVPAASAAPTELFFSEYVEGSSNNKALEIYNGTGAPIDLGSAGYNVQMFFNGSASAGLTVNLTGTVASGDVFVLAHGAANAQILAQADQTNGSGWYNGDDAVVLRKGTTAVDVIGQIGVDPGSEWGTGLTSTADNTLMRKAGIEAGDTNGANPFSPAVEWDGYATDTFGGLGSYDIAPTVSTSPFPGQTGVAPGASVTVTFSEPVDVADGWYTLDCSITGSRTADVTGGPTTFVVDPTSDFVNGDQCTLVITATAVTDQDAADPPDNLAVNRTVSFLVETEPCTAPVATITPIPEIQGSGAETGKKGSTVTTRGVVVGDFEGATPGQRGFFIQAETGDGNPATSDGIFVFEGSNADTVNLGDVVRVTGNAGENQGQTQVSVGTIITCGTGSVPPTDVTFPVASDTFLERYEGMMVRLPQEMTVTEHFQLGRFGQVVLSQGGRLAQPTNVVAPGDPAKALQAANNLRKIILDDASQAQNPDPILFARGDQPLSASNTLRGGDTATGIVGVMTYTWAGNSASPNAYRVRPVNALGGSVDFVPANPRPAGAPEVGGSIQVAGMNVLNFFNTFDGSPDNANNCTLGVGGDATDCRGADTQTELDRQWPKTVAEILGSGADVIGINEIENDGYGSDSAIAFLVGKLNGATAPGTWAFIDADARTGEVNALGTDAIKVGLLYQPAKVTPVGATAALNTVAFVNGGDSDPRSRPALAQAFRETATGGNFVTVVNHLKSKGSACDAPDAGDGQGNCNDVRTNAVEELISWLGTDPTGAGDSDVLLVGDLNSYAKEDPVTTLQEAGFANLIQSRLGDDAYSYVFDGQWGYLDHALATGSMDQQVTGVADWHINADEPSVLDYNTDFKSAAQIASLYAPDEFRTSDHDPVLVGLDLEFDAPDAFATGGGWFSSPAGAVVAAPTVSGRAEFQFSARYEPGSMTPTGSMVLDLPSAGFSLSSTGLDWLVVSGSTARFAGGATVNGASGYRVEVTTTDGIKKSDTLRVVVLDENGAKVYDSGLQTVKGQVAVHD